MAVIVSAIVGYFTHWLVGVAIVIYWLSRILLHKQAAAPKTPSEKGKRIEDMRRRDEDEEDRQLLHRYGAYDHLVDEERFNSLD